ncbi:MULTISPECIES: AI-2E family transporter [Rhizobium/Agrobacterium group]|uniref:AI-2E family transporter n=1 Tax=Rhizobium rhizogenes TaxID=359 RepID=A0A546XB43_RHIRH|nr:MULTISPECIES: AI-2E family transporter [Rhizobium/Agrobacterium group]TRA97974.1 AI-2E family transporter [Rhizobium rhizogenes]
MSNPTLVGPVFLIATIAFISALQIAAAVFAPIAGALLVIALVWPVQKTLQNRLPRLLALAIVVGIIICVFTALASVSAWGFGRIGRSIVSDAPRFQMLYSNLVTWLEGHGIVVAGLWAEHFNVGWLLRMLQGVTARLNTTISFWIVVVVYVLLGLLDTDAVARNIRKALAKDTADAVIGGAMQTAAKLRRYMFVRTLMSLATGIMVWVLSAVFGLRFATEWGVIAFALNYIPFMGPFIATLLPSAYALAQFGSPEAAIFIFAGLNVIQFAIGSYIEPRVAGYALAMSPFLVLFSVFFWSSIWGVFGAFIGVPITIAIITFCAQFAGTRWIAVVLGAPSGRDKTDDVPDSGSQT